MLTLIVATDKNGGIGLQGRLPWDDKTEMAHFRTVTQDSTLIMGYSTYLSLKDKTLKGRRCIVVVYSNRAIDKDTRLEHVNFMKFHEVTALLKQYPDAPFFVIGGKMTYLLFEPYCDVVIWSKGDFVCRSDIYYRPPVFNGEWRKIESNPIGEHFIANIYKRTKQSLSPETTPPKD